VNIQTAEMAVGRNVLRIKTASIGSCVVIALYDHEAKVGGMAHAMLPGWKKEKARNDTVEDSSAGPVFRLAKYAGEAVDRLVEEIEKRGGKRERLRAKLVGGAKMFHILGDGSRGIGYRNIETVRSRLSQLGIPIESEDTGGTVGRIAELNLENGALEVSTKM